MDTHVRKQLESLENSLLAAPVRSVLGSSTWAEDVPAVPGVYALWDGQTGDAIYVGETTSLRERMADFGRTLNHTCRRKIIDILELRGRAEAEINVAMSKRYYLSFIPVYLGRAELEDYLALRWRETILNQPAARLLRGDIYAWVQPSKPCIKPPTS
jgi:hypothetical protein